MVLMSTIQFLCMMFAFPHTHTFYLRYLPRLSYSSGDCWHAMGNFMDYYNHYNYYYFFVTFLLGTQIFLAHRFLASTNQCEC
ncbi:hypothetical protein F4776DRAFT_332339 [Hypoxylon sp. NC0597]|nr:hypothetical protein F4776DRAFT_332339 [Hypoxylon sp. NC0597]